MRKRAYALLPCVALMAGCGGSLSDEELEQIVQDECIQTVVGAGISKEVAVPMCDCMVERRAEARERNPEFEASADPDATLRFGEQCAAEVLNEEAGSGQVGG